MEDPEFHKRGVATNRRIALDPTTRANQAEAAKRRWEDPEQHANSSEAHIRQFGRPGAREKASAAAKRRWEDPAEREKLVNARRNRKTEIRHVGTGANIAAGVKKYYELEANRIAHSERMKLWWKDRRGGELS